MVFSDDDLHPDCVPLLCTLLDSKDLRSQIRALDSALHIILTTHALEYNPMSALTDKFAEMLACSDHLVNSLKLIVEELPEPVIRSFYVFDIVNGDQFILNSGKTSKLYQELQINFRKNVHYLKMIALDRLINA